MLERNQRGRTEEIVFFFLAKHDASGDNGKGSNFLKGGNGGGGGRERERVKKKLKTRGKKTLL